MYLCNASVGLSIFGYVHVNFTDCSKHIDIHGNKGSAGKDSNAMGAMQYTVAVFLVYGIAVLGVFGLGINHRRKQRRYNMDHEARKFLKNYENVRRICEQRSRVGAVNALLRQLHNEPEASDNHSDPNVRKGRPSVNSLAFLPISLSIIEEDEAVGELYNENDRRYSNGVDGNRIPPNDNVIVDDKLKVHKSGIKRTNLGSSRRSYKSCKMCLATRGVTVSRDNCRCLTTKTLFEEISNSCAWNELLSEEIRTFPDVNKINTDSKL
ncbi:hypothetical protein ACF0H5_005442 [Mactra antiquata]